MRDNLIRELRPNVFAHLEKVGLIWSRLPWWPRPENRKELGESLRLSVRPRPSGWRSVAWRRTGRLFHAANPKLQMLTPRASLLLRAAAKCDAAATTC